MRNKQAYGFVFNGERTAAILALSTIVLLSTTTITTVFLIMGILL
jgi:hypothetical protein